MGANPYIPYQPISFRPLLKSLASDYKSDKDSVSARVPSTCAWFFKDDRFLDDVSGMDNVMLGKLPVPV